MSNALQERPRQEGREHGGARSIQRYMLPSEVPWSGFSRASICTTPFGTSSVLETPGPGIQLLALAAANGQRRGPGYPSEYACLSSSTASMSEVAHRIGYVTLVNAPTHSTATTSTIPKLTSMVKRGCMRSK